MMTEDSHGPASVAAKQTATLPAKISELTLTDNLLFAFFGSNSDRVAGRETLLKELNELLIRLFDDVSQGRFDRSSHKWITDQVIKDYFDNRKFHPTYKLLKNKEQHYENPKSKNFRTVIAALCAVSRNVFLDADSEFPGAIYARNKLGIGRNSEEYRDRLKVLGEIERTLSKIENKPMGAVSFDDSCHVIVKTRNPQHFPHRSEQERLERIVGGRWILYRPLFEVTDPTHPFIREYVIIDPRRYGVEVQWHTNAGTRSKSRVYAGAGWFADGALWVMVHCNEPFKRMRVLAAGLAEWEAYVDGQKGFCTAEVLGHSDENGKKNAKNRVAVLVRESKKYWEERNQPFAGKIMLLSQDDLSAELPDEALRTLAGRDAPQFP